MQEQQKNNTSFDPKYNFVFEQPKKAAHIILGFESASDSNNELDDLEKTPDS